MSSACWLSFWEMETFPYPQWRKYRESPIAPSAGHGKGNLSAETRARILAFIDQFCHRPNAVAQSPAKNQTFHIGLTMQDRVSKHTGPLPLRTGDQ